MKIIKSAFVFMVATMLVSLTANAKDTMKRIYIYGCATSFNDSTVYLTDIEVVDSAWFTGKKKMFLVSRENYSYQLRDYLEQQGEKNQTCMVTFGTNLKTVKKKWNKLNDRFTKVKVKKNKQGKKEDTTPAPFQVKIIGMDKFKFTGVPPQDENIASESTQETHAPKVKAKKALKQQKKKKSTQG